MPDLLTGLVALAIVVVIFVVIALVAGVRTPELDWTR